jgi:outer membrane immunogenic protein
MKKLALAVVAAAAFTGSAGAADMPARTYSKAPPPPPVAVVNWTGCYVGAGGGGAFTNNDNNLFIVPNAPPFPSANKTDGARGWFGTVQGGCDYQFGNWVVGAFADYDFSDIKGDHLGFNLNQVGQQKQDWSWAVGGRVGYLIVPQLLTYVSGGFTQAHWKGTTYLSAASGIVLPPVTTDGSTRSGWFVGTGDEYALNFFLPGLFWKTEYRYSEFDARDTQFFTVAPVTPTGQFIHEKIREHSVRSELVYRFNWAGPVVAKY